MANPVCDLLNRETRTKGGSLAAPPPPPHAARTEEINKKDVSIYVWSPHVEEYGSTGKFANPARGQLNRENVHYGISLFPFAPMNLVSRDGFGCPVLRQPAHLDTQAKFGILTKQQNIFEVGY